MSWANRSPSSFCWRAITSRSLAKIKYWRALYACVLVQSLKVSHSWEISAFSALLEHSSTHPCIALWIPSTMSVLSFPSKFLFSLLLAATGKTPSDNCNVKQLLLIVFHRYIAYGTVCTHEVSSESDQVKTSPENGAFQWAARQVKWWQFSGDQPFGKLPIYSVLYSTVVARLWFSRLLWSWGAEGIGLEQVRVPQSLLFLLRFLE